jgi:hypothetical protein
MVEQQFQENIKVKTTKELLQMTDYMKEMDR